MDIEWRIYYGDGSVFSSDQGSAGEAPPFNIQAVVQFDQDVGRQILNGFDWYILKDDKWYGILDIPSLLDQLLHDLDRIQAVKMGRLIPSEQYQDIMRRAKQDQGLPIKNATSRIEKPYGSKN